MDNISNESRFLSEATVLTGRYVIQSVIGAGGFGITYKAWDRLMEQNVAIKEYYPAGVVARQIGGNTVSISTENYREEFVKGKQRFLAEAKELVKLKDSAYVVNVQNFFEENSTAYMAMEFLNGVTLGQYYKNMGGRVDVESSLKIMGKIMTALEEIHNAGIIHRDISPENIFVLSDGNVKLIDFGAAKQAYCGETQNLSIMLKPGYAPPEQYSNNTPQGPWTDIYAFGATMYRMLTGKKPAESVSRMLNDTLVPPSVINPEIPAYLNNAILKSMAIKPEDRFHNAFEYRNAVFNPSMQDNTPVASVAGTSQGANNPGFVQNTMGSGQPNYAQNTTGNDGTVILNQSAGGYVQGASHINPQQPAWGNAGYTQGNNYNFVNNNMQGGPSVNTQGRPPANNNKGKLIVIICLALCLIGGGVFAAIKLGGKDKGDDSTTTEYVVAEDKKTEDKKTEELTDKPTTEFVVTEAPTEAPTEATTEYKPEVLANGIELPDTNSDVRLTVYSKNEELLDNIEYFYKKYPEYRDRIDYHTINTVDESAFCEQVNLAYAAGEGVDVVYHDEQSLDDLSDSGMYVDLSDIGFKDSYYAGSYSFATKKGTVDGKLRGVTYQAVPGVMLYRMDIAKEVFGTEQPNELVDNFYDWDSYLKTAEAVKEAGYYINSSPGELQFGSMADYDLDEVSEALVSGGYTKNTKAWSLEWTEDMDNDVLAYFACPWFVTYILSSSKSWSITYAPCYYSWGGSYLSATKDCAADPEKCRLATLLFYTLCCDEEVLRQMADDTGDCPNNKNVVDAIAALASYPNPKILNNNPFYYYKEALDGLDGLN